MTKMDIITGFLGAGKTTLVKKLISENTVTEKIVLIENEFGDVNIDSQFLQDTQIEITELTSGCICCTLLGDFGAALKKIMAEINPDRIIVEPSGVAKATDVIKAVKIAAIPEIVINSISNVVDASICDVYIEEFGEFYRDQIRHAGCILMSRTDECDEEELKAATEAVKSVNANAILVTTPWNELSGEQIYQGMCLGKKVINAIFGDSLAHHESESAHSHNHGRDDNHVHVHVHNKASDVFSTVSYETINHFSQEELLSRLSSLDQCQGKVLRAKGVVKSGEGEWLHFDYVPNKQEIRSGSPSITGLICVIGKDIENNEIRSALFN